MSTIYIREQGQLAPLDIPEYRGDRGEAGQTPDLQVGSVTALPNDQQASVTIQGNKENPTINFGLPSGETGDKGLYVGRPEDAYDETKVVFDDENWIDDTYFENSTVDYMGGEHESLKEKSDSDVEYILRKFGTQHYEGSSITASNTYAMQVKSAMFKGQTLVNLSEINKFSLSGSGSYVITAKSDKFKTNTDYTRIVFITKNTLTGSNGGNVAQPHKDGWEATVFFTNANDGIPENFTGLLQKRKFTTPSTFSVHVRQMSAIRIFGVNTGGVLEGYEIILEGDYTNQDIPYFEGMKSVKSSMLTVTSADSTHSHTLTTPQEVILRSLPNGVCDTLNLITGEYVRRIEEVFINDVMNNVTWSAAASLNTTNNIAFFYKENNIKAVSGGKDGLGVVISDGLPYLNRDALLQDIEGIASSDKNIIFKISKSKLPSSLTVNVFKTWLQSNPITVYYELAIPIITTIDLQNQKIYSYDGTTHYTTSSSLEGHPNPILSIDVPTNITSLLKHQQNTINRQRLVLSEREEMQNILIESMLYRYEQSTLLNDTIEVVPDYIQKLYEVAYQRGIRFRKEE